MNNKEKYKDFCSKTYVPIYSMPWWLDAICGEENWDVWLYVKNEEVMAAMPYYMENRDGYKYITKAPLTQNNGIIFKDEGSMKLSTYASFQEHVIDEATDYIKNMKIDVYEQQYPYSFTNWLPFFWKRYTSITRYTYVIENTKDLDGVWNNISSNYRKKIRKGMKNSEVAEGLDYNVFWEEHKKIFQKQGLECPFSYDLWVRLYHACKEHNAGKIIYAKNADNNILSILFLVWDERSVYQLLGGSIPEFQHLESYNLLTWSGIKYASEQGLKYDFEGSVIKNISKSMREFGGIPKPYFRIRKVFNEDILQKEYEIQLDNLYKEKIYIE